MQFGRAPADTTVLRLRGSGGHVVDAQLPIAGRQGAAGVYRLAAARLPAMAALCRREAAPVTAGRTAAAMPLRLSIQPLQSLFESALPRLASMPTRHVSF